MVATPEVSHSAGTYLYQWKDEQVYIRIDRLSEHRDEVTGEITVRTTNPGVSPHLHQARLNLTSTSARKTLARALTDRLALSWDDFIEYACVLTLTEHRRGEPIVQVGNLPAQDEAAYRLWPLVREREPTVVYGDGGVGKSLLGALSLLLVETGKTAAGLNGYPEPVRGLYLDWESSAEELDERVKGFRAGLGLGPEIELAYRFCVQPLPADIAEVQRAVTEEGYRFLVIDSLGLACGGDPESAQVALSYFAALRSLRLPSLTLHHIPKDKDRGPFGSRYIWNMARNVWELKKEQEEDSDTLYLGLYHRKVNRGRRMKPLGLRLTFQEGGAIVPQTQNVLDVPQLAAGAPLRDRIRRALAHGARTVAEISDEAAAPADQVRVLLNKHKDTFVNLASSQKEGKWGLVQTVEP